MDTDDYIKLYGLKVDPKLPHHYIIGICMKPITDKNAGKIFLKYGPLHFTNADLVECYDAIKLSEDKAFKTSKSDALGIFDPKGIMDSISAMQEAARANMGTVHHFSTEYPIDDEWFVSFIETAHLDSTKKLLKEARIRG
jgi:hypothetical protein